MQEDGGWACSLGCVYYTRRVRTLGPVVRALELEPRSDWKLPEPYRSRMLPRETRGLAAALGLTRLGANLTCLPPGKESSMRHYHTHDDELIFVLEGELVLRTAAGEQVMTAGDCAGFVAGDVDGHQLINRSDRPARYLEISSKDARDVPVYVDDDLRAAWSSSGEPILTLSLIHI